METFHASISFRLFKVSDGGRISRVFQLFLVSGPKTFQLGIFFQIPQLNFPWKVYGKFPQVYWKFSASLLLYFQACLFAPDPTDTFSFFSPGARKVRSTEKISSKNIFFTINLKEVMHDSPYETRLDNLRSVMWQIEKNKPQQTACSPHQSSEARCILEEPVDWADGFVVVYNISDRTSFINAKNVLRQIREARPDNCKGSAAWCGCFVLLDWSVEQNNCHIRYTFFWCFNGC